MSATWDIEGLPELKADLNTFADRLVVGLRGASLEAAAAGILAARQDHPYTDRTFHLSGEGDGGDDENSHAEQSTRGGSRNGPQDEDEAKMVWPVRYAGFVDKGTSRSRAYPFTPIAEQIAENVLGNASEQAVDDACREFDSK